ncbi:hypothetical protein GA0074696_0181 [Micromonospora purpureochromogenes]|uniref:Methylamine utilisation protein MauE domain-containing protein n=1 Tax=Micromonospora purpureochromogenes TaxID=47872 RepID=A0A1C4U819_9ACTN|nr:MauE/DoxX family redox-associated membrane protein [Micromonospora purpureochromogenes]SCE67835.1 hypothetical protein GA0074696_0181 [Micromonospora purpureochromogenes]
MTYLDVFLRAMLITVFGLAAVGKLRSRAAFTSFADSLASVGVGTRRRRDLAAAMVAVTETAIVAGLAVPATVTDGYALALLTLAVFTAAVGRALHSGRVVRCRCFLGDGGEMNRGHLLRNAVLAGAAAAGLMLRWTAQPAATVDVAAGLAGLAGLVVGLGVTHWDDLTHLFRPVEAAAARRR